MSITSPNMTNISQAKPAKPTPPLSTVSTVSLTSQNEACEEFRLFHRPLFEVLSEVCKYRQAMSPVSRSYYEDRLELFRALSEVVPDQDPDEGTPLRYRGVRNGWVLITQSNDLDNDVPESPTVQPPAHRYAFKKYRDVSLAPSSNPFHLLLFKESLAFLQLAALNELRCVHRYFLQLPIRTFSWIYSTIPFLATMTVPVLQAIVERNLAERRHKDPLVKSIISHYQNAVPRRPGIYMASLVNKGKSEGPTTEQLEYVAMCITEYLQSLEDWTPPVQHMHAFLCTNIHSEMLKQAAMGYYRTPTRFRSSPECIAVRQWCDAVLLRANRIKGEGRKLPVTPPLCYFGFSKDLGDPNFGIGSKRSDYPMLLVTAFCDQLLDDDVNAFKLEVAPVCFPFTTKLTQAAQLFFNAISGSFVRSGGGFAYEDDDVGLLSPVQVNDGQIWERNFRWVLANTPFKENMMDEVEFWKEQLSKA